MIQRPKTQCCASLRTMSALLRGPNAEPRASTKLDETLTLLTVCGRGVDVCSVNKSAAGFQERVSCEARAGRSVRNLRRALIVFPSGNYELLAAPFFGIGFAVSFSWL